MMVREGFKEVRVGPKVVGIPNEWEIMKLNNLSKNKGQYGANESANEFDENEYRYLRITDITGDGRLSNDDKKSIKKNDKNKKYLLEPGDIVFARTGSVGRTYLFRKNDLEMPTVFAGYLIKFKLDKEITNYEYLFHYTHSFLYNSWVNSFARSTTLANINAGEYRDLPVVYPPLPEQKNIASILSSVDKSKEKTDEVIEETKELKKGLMQELLTKGIGHSEFKEVRIGPRLIIIPEAWQFINYGELFESGPQNGLYKSNEFYGGNSSFIAELSNLYETNKYLKIDNLSNLILTEKEISRYKLSKNDILINRVSKVADGVAKTILIPDLKKDQVIVFESNMMRATLNMDLVSPEYILYYSDSKEFRNEIKRTAKFSNQVSITQNSLTSIKIPVPPLSEQKKIASILSSVDAKIQKEEEYKAKLERLKKGLMQKLLTGEIRVNTEMEV